MISTNQTADFIYIILLFVLVGSALIARRVPLGKSVRMFAGWVIIFLTIFAAFLFRDDIRVLGQRLAGGRRAESTGQLVGRELHIKQALDGHFWVNGTLNGQNVRFLIDSGATTTSISTATAERAGITSNGEFPVLVQTANGVVEARRGRAALLRIGPIERADFAVHISSAFGDMNVLGMNFLSSLSAWRVENNTLILLP